jgi:hypothetical protein
MDNPGKSMKSLLVFAAAAIMLSACVPDPAPTTSTPAQSSRPLSAQPGKNCELKNPTGTGNCEDGSSASAAADPQASSATTRRTAATDRPFVPSDCTAGIGRAYILMAELGHRMAAWKAYCSPGGGGLAAQAGDSGSQSGDGQVQTVKASGKGCVWKGRAYSPGDTIYAQQVGDIFMRDVLVNGRSFDTFITPGHNLSQPGDKAQMCECQRSVQHWGCV